MDFKGFVIPTAPTKQVNNHIHSELHEVVAILRKEFEETAKKGKGSFGFYLRMLKKVPTGQIRTWLAEIRDSPKLTTPDARCRVFWWNYSRMYGAKSKQPKQEL